MQGSAKACPASGCFSLSVNTGIINVERQFLITVLTGMYSLFRLFCFPLLMCCVALLCSLWLCFNAYAVDQACAPGLINCIHYRARMTKSKF